MGLADDVEQMVAILAWFPQQGLTMDEIYQTAKDKDIGWTTTGINDILCAMKDHRQIAFSRTRERGRKVTRYYLTPEGAASA